MVGFSTYHVGSKQVVVRRPQQAYHRSTGALAGSPWPQLYQMGKIAKGIEAEIGSEQQQ